MYHLQAFIHLHSRWRVHQESDSESWACGSSGFIQWWEGKHFLFLSLSSIYICLFFLPMIFGISHPLSFHWCVFLSSARMRSPAVRCYSQSISHYPRSKQELRAAPSFRAPLGPAGTTIWRPQSLSREREKTAQRCVCTFVCEWTIFFWTIIQNLEL